jgi:hypothetical protein
MLSVSANHACTVLELAVCFFQYVVLYDITHYSLERLFKMWISDGDLCGLEQLQKNASAPLSPTVTDTLPADTLAPMEYSWCLMYNFRLTRN